MAMHKSFKEYLPKDGGVAIKLERERVKGNLTLPDLNSLS